MHLTEEQYQTSYAGVPTAANAVDMVSRFTLNEDPSVLAEEKIASIQAFLDRDGFPLMPGVRETLVQLHSHGVRLAIVTGAGTSGVRSTLREHGLSEFFETVVSSDDVHRSKPAPDCYLLAVERLGLLPLECIAIEDTEHGVVAATAAEIACVAIPTTLSNRHNFSRATAVLREIGEVPSWIASRWMSRR